MTKRPDPARRKDAAKKKDAVFERQGYHHGNLKEALIAAARRLIAERGPAGFTLVEAARLAGVSAAAPYRHFKDREALIAEVAQRGFAEFGTRLAAAWRGVGGDPQTGFARMGTAYLEFARAEPGYYGSMFARGGAQQTPPHRKAGGPAFAALEHAIAQVAGRAGAAVDAGPTARRLAYQVWAFSHGIAMLSGGGMLPTDDPALTPVGLLQNGVTALIRGSVRASAGGTPPTVPVPPARPK